VHVVCADVSMAIYSTGKSFFFFKADAVYYAESYVRMFHDCETQLHCDISF